MLSMFKEQVKLLQVVSLTIDLLKKSDLYKQENGEEITKQTQSINITNVTNSNISGVVDIVNNSKVNKYVHSDARTSEPASKKWYEKPSGILSLGIAASLIAALIWWWYSPYLEKQKTSSIKPTNESNSTNSLTLQNTITTTSSNNVTAVSAQDKTPPQKEKSISVSTKTKAESKSSKGEELKLFIQELDKEIEQKKLEITNNPGLAHISKDKVNDKSESDLRLEKELEGLETQRTLARQRLIETLAK